MSNIKEMIANRKGQSLIEHNAAVAHMALTLAKEDKLAEDLPHVKQELYESIYVGALLHDIAKVNPEFQDHIKSNIVNMECEDGCLDETAAISNGKPYLLDHYRHNELSFLAMSALWGDQILKRKFVRALYGIYFHHEIPITSLEESRVRIPYIELKPFYPQLKEMVKVLVDNYLSSDYLSKQFDMLIDSAFVSFKDDEYVMALFESDRYGKLDPYSLYTLTPELEKKEGKYRFKDENINSESALRNSLDYITRIYISRADQFISSFSAEEVSQYLNNTRNSKIYTEMAHNITRHPEAVSKLAKPLITKPDCYESERFNLQCSYVEEILNPSDEKYASADIIVNAPAGFGKTAIMLMAFHKSSAKQLIVLTPRKNIVESDYKNLIDECQTLGLKYSIGMYHGTSRKMCDKNQEDIDISDDEYKALQANIVVTTVDTVLNSVIAKRNMEFTHSALTSMVAFDEYHEFYTSAALFASYVILARTRHLYARQINGNKTIYLSASPLPIYQLTSIFEKEPCFHFIPGEHEHAPCQHNKKYTFCFEELTDDISAKPNSMFMVNSIKNAQRVFKISGFQKPYDYICHSEYTDTDKGTIVNAIRDTYGKSQKGVKKVESVVSTRILQASEDISFKSLCLVHSSPESTLQSVGRCNRWGEYDQSDITYMFIPAPTYTKDGRLDDSEFIKKFRRSDAYALDVTYGKDVCNMWQAHMLQALRDKKSITLTQLYKIYNEFYRNNGDAVIRLMHDTYAKSLSALCEFNFVTTQLKQSKDSNPVTNKTRGIIKKYRTLREIGGLFYIVRYNGEEATWVDEPLSESGVAVINLLKDAGEDSNFTPGNLHTVADSLERDGLYPDLVSYLKSLSSDKKTSKKPYADQPSEIRKELKSMACNSKTPYIVFGRRYDKKLGLLATDLDVEID